MEGGWREGEGGREEGRKRCGSQNRRSDSPFFGDACGGEHIATSQQGTAEFGLLLMEACKFAVPFEVPDGSAERKDLPFIHTKFNQHLIALLLTDMSSSVVYGKIRQRRRKPKKGVVTLESVPETFLPLVLEKGTKEQRGVTWLEDVLYARQHVLRCLAAGERESQEGETSQEMLCSSQFFSFCLQFAWDKTLTLGGASGKTFKTWSTLRPVLQQLFLDSLQSDVPNAPTEGLVKKCLQELADAADPLDRQEHLEVPDILKDAIQKTKLVAWVAGNSPKLPIELTEVWNSVLSQTFARCPCTTSINEKCELHQARTVATFVTWLSQAACVGKLFPARWCITVQPAQTGAAQRNTEPHISRTEGRTESHQGSPRSGLRCLSQGGM